MLSIGKLGAGQARYYLDKVAEGAGDYYSGEGEAQGKWLGDATRELGLAGEVEPDQLIAMLSGHDPATGEPLGLQHVRARICRPLGAFSGSPALLGALSAIMRRWRGERRRMSALTVGASSSGLNRR